LAPELRHFLNYLQKAEAELAYELQAAKTKQRIKEEQMQIKVIERTQEILVQVI
jgi:flotillin